jgi:hypothetical protein
MSNGTPAIPHQEVDLLSMDDNPTPSSPSRGLSEEEARKAGNAYNAAIIAAPQAKSKM